MHILRPIDIERLKEAKKFSRCHDQKVAAGLYGANNKLLFAACNQAMPECEQKCIKLSGKECKSIHAEQTLVNMIKGSNIIITPDMFILVTLQPCQACLNALAAIGIKQVYYLKTRGEELSIDKCHCDYVSIDTSKSFFNLHSLFGEIKTYQKLVNADEVLNTKRQKVNLAKQLILSLHSETNEVLNTMDWKYWKQTNGEVEFEHFKEEMADVFFFWVELLTIFNISVQEIEEAITDKLMVNYNRLTEKK